MKKNLFKGFTIVELVIVIAVIGILAAVLIPTFNDIVSRANETSDISFCASINKELNVFFLMEFPDSPNKVFETLLQNGYSHNDFVPKSKDSYFAYDFVNNKFLLMDSSLQLKYGADNLSDQIWIIINQENQAEEVLLAGEGNFGLILIKEGVVDSLYAPPKILYADENNLQTLIASSTHVNTVIKLASSCVSILRDIVIDQQNAVTLDFDNNITPVDFEDSIIKNYGEIKIINANLTKYDTICLIENYGTLSMVDVKINASGNNTANAVLCNYGTLNLNDCVVIADAGSCLKNTEGSTLNISGGEYSANAFSCIENNGVCQINGGNFIRQNSDVESGVRGSVYAVLNNAGINASATVKEGVFLNAYLSMPSARSLLVINNDNAKLFIEGGTFENSCNNSKSCVVYVKNPQSEVIITGGVYTLASQEALFLSVSKVSQSKVSVKNITLYGSVKLLEDGFEIKNSYKFYNYMIGQTSCLIFSDTQPSSFEARVNGDFYLDVDQVTTEDFAVGNFIQLNAKPAELSVELDRNYLTETNSFVLVYGVEMEEVVTVASDYIMQKIDLSGFYKEAFLAYRYFVDITEETATFKAEYLDGSISYFSLDDWYLLTSSCADKITLLKDISRCGTENLIFTVENDITFDLNGKTWKEYGEVSCLLTVGTGEKTLKIVDSSIEQKGKMIFEGKENAMGLLCLIGNVEINGGSFESNGNVLYVFGSDSQSAIDYSEKIYQVKGGIFKGDIVVAQAIYHGTLIVSGGVFDKNPSAYLAENCSVSIGGDGSFIVSNSSSIPNAGISSLCYNTNAVMLQKDRKNYFNKY